MAYRVLFIDDDEFIRKIYVDRLTASGMEVTPAANAADGMQLFTQKDFDLVCSDYLLPDKSGKEIVTWIRTEQKSDVPIMVFSASGQEVQIKEIMEAGATEYIQKDHVVPTELVAKMKALMDATKS